MPSVLVMAEQHLTTRVEEEGHFALGAAGFESHKPAAVIRALEADIGFPTQEFRRIDQVMFSARVAIQWRGEVSVQAQGAFLVVDRQPLATDPIGGGSGPMEIAHLQTLQTLQLL
jgi:hypothetical protein